MDKELITSKLLFRLLAAVPVLLSGCAEFEDYSSSKNDSEYVEMVFTQDNKGTKAEIGEDGSGSFTEGDKVGLYIYGEQTRQVILTMEDGQWTPKLQKSELGSGTVRLSAYYPAREDVSPETNLHTHRVDTDQTGNGYEDSDLLWSHLDIEQEDITGDVIEMPFMHGMHRLSINISSDEGSLPDDLTVTVRNITEGSFDLSTGGIDTPSGTMEDITPRILSEGKYSAILSPGILGNMPKDGWRFPQVERHPSTRHRLRSEKAVCWRAGRRPYSTCVSNPTEISEPTLTRILILILILTRI